MQTPIFLAYASDRPLPEGLRDRRISIIEKHYELTRHHERVSLHTDNIGIFHWNLPNSRVLIPLARKTSNEMKFSCHLPFGAGKVVPASTLAEGEYPTALIDMVQNDGATLRSLNPPAILGDISLERGNLRLLNDAIGFGRLYEFSGAQITVWTNRLAFGPIFAGEPPESDIDGWATLAQVGWFLGEKTAYKNARVLPPATLVQSSGRRETTRHRKVYSTGAEFGGARTPTEQHLEQIVEDIDGIFTESSAFLTVPLTFGLSGGRDSRLITALALRQRQDIDLHTAFPPNLELEIVESLIEAAPMKLNWQPIDRTRRAKPDAESISLLDKATQWLKLTDGDMMPSSIMRPPPKGIHRSQHYK